MTLRRPTAAELSEARALGLPIADAVMRLPDLPEPRFVPVEDGCNPFEPATWQAHTQHDHGGSRRIGLGGFNTFGANNSHREPTGSGL